jgi:hypothetical protein
MSNHVNSVRGGSTIMSKSTPTTTNLNTMSEATKQQGNGEYRVVVVKTSSANTGSMVATLRRCGATTVTITDDPAIVSRAQLVVVPGVSSFGRCVANVSHFLQATHFSLSLSVFLLC